MRIINARDVLALVTGLTTRLSDGGTCVSGRYAPLGINPLILVFVVPVAWIAGVQFGYFLGTMFRPFIQFGRFVAIGFSNAAVDFGVLYLLIAYSGLAAGLAYSVFKALSFSVATVHSYYWNKNWAFEAGASHGGGREAASFVAVAVVGLLVNVSVASLVVALHPAEIDIKAWAGIGAVVGAAAALIISFTGFRVFVFSKK